MPGLDIKICLNIYVLQDGERIICKRPILKKLKIIGVLTAKPLALVNFNS
jgi:hypothetical protein